MKVAASPQIKKSKILRRFQIMMRRTNPVEPFEPIEPAKPLIKTS